MRTQNRRTTQDKTTDPQYVDPQYIDPQYVDASSKLQSNGSKPSSEAAGLPAFASRRTKASQIAPRRAWLDPQRFVAIVAVLFVTAIGTVFLLQRDPRPPATTASQWRPLPEKDPEVTDEPVLASSHDAKPVQIRNEFDHNEVFEFPPGTSQREARDQVARILLQRAMERQASSSTAR